MTEQAAHLADRTDFCYRLAAQYLNTHGVRADFLGHPEPEEYINELKLLADFVKRNGGTYYCGAGGLTRETPEYSVPPLGICRFVSFEPPEGISNLISPYASLFFSPDESPGAVLLTIRPDSVFCGPGPRPRIAGGVGLACLRHVRETISNGLPPYQRKRKFV